ncbi:MAG TPA: hypothetical protein ENK86_07165 [Campylobacterales bacterium]|nr:hypothetical protein [Campylobacterales bacterium]
MPGKKKNKKKAYWEDFSQKIDYLYINLFNEDLDKMAEYFNDKYNPKPKNSRKKTLKNWRENITQKPNLNLSRYKLNDEYRYSSGDPIFTLDTFKSWSFERFKRLVDDLILKTNIESKPINALEYIYYFNLETQSVDYYCIEYPNENDPCQIELTSQHLTYQMRYIGKITEYHNMIYIFVKNDYDHMVYILENRATIFQQKLKIYGVGLCKDFASRQPKSYIAFFSSEKLDTNEILNFRHKLGNSNTLIAKNFSRGCLIEEDFLFENLINKIDNIRDDLLPSYEELESINKYYNDILIKEFNSYATMLKKADQEYDFFITNRRKLHIYSLQNIVENSGGGVLILYTLNQSTLHFFYELLNNQEEAFYLHSIYLKYILVIEETSILTGQLIEECKKLEKRGIEVKFLSENPTTYSEFLLIVDEPFAMYRTGKEIVDNTFITKKRRKIDELRNIFEILDRHAYALEAFLNQECQINGKWYTYSYTSKEDTSVYQTVEMEIQNGEVIAHFSTGTEYGIVYKTEKQTLLIFTETVIKIINNNIDQYLFKVSIAGKELHLKNRDILLYGLFSREPLLATEVHPLLDTLYLKDGHQFRLKMSDTFNSFLAEFKTQKYNTISLPKPS